MNPMRAIRGEHGSIRRTAWVTMLIVAVLLAGVMAEHVFASTYPFKSTTIYADGTRTAKFTCNGMTGFCCEAGAYSTYSGTANLSRMKNASDAAHCAYYYGYQKGWTSGSNGHKLARLLSYCMGHGTGGDFSAASMKSLLQTAKKTPVPEGFECWLCKPNGSSKQDFIVWKYPKGKLKVVKKSGNTSVSKKGSYTLAGMTIKVYSDAACKTCVKTLTTAKDGSTGGAFSLHVGTYYVKETKVPGSTGFVKNDKVIKVKVTSGSTASVAVTNAPDTGSVSVEKTTTGEGGRIEGFRFVLTGKTSGKTYELVTDAAGKASVTGLPFGKYTLTELLTAEQEAVYTDCTGVQSFRLAKEDGSQHITLQRENKYEPQQKLKIVKRTGDGGPVGGFTFRIRWLRADQKTITGEEIVRAAQPQISLGSGQSAGIWQIEDPAQVEAINEAAAQGKTGAYPVKLRNTVTTVPEAAGAGEESAGEATSGAETKPVGDAEHAGTSDPGEDAGDTGNGRDPGSKTAAGKEAAGTEATSSGDAATSEDEAPAEEDEAAEPVTSKSGAAEADIVDADDGKAGSGADDTPSQISGEGRTDTVTVQVTVNLMPAAVAAEAEQDEAARTAQTEGTGTAQATEPDAVRAGEPETQNDGPFAIACRSISFAGAATSGEETAQTNAAGQILLEHVWPGTYTVTEELTDRQKLRYRQPDPQTARVEADREETVVFTFMNDPIRVPVKLQKTSADGQIADVEFTITGDPDYAEEPMEDVVVQTDEAGIADFGMLYPGNYRIEETGFDKTRYQNTYPLGTGEKPAFEFRVTGEELTPAQIQAGDSLWLGGAPGQGVITTEKVTFRNIPFVDLRLTKVDGITRSFLPGAAFSLQDSSGRSVAAFRIDADGDGQPLPVLLEGADGVRLEQAEEVAGEPLVIGGSAQASAAKTQTQETKEAERSRADSQNLSSDGIALMRAQAADETDRAAGEEAADQPELNTGAETADQTEQSTGAAASESASVGASYPCVVLHGLLAEEKYTLTETQAPEGFTSLEEPYVFTVTIDEKGRSSLQTCDEYGANIAAAARGDVLVVVNDAPSIGTVALDNDTGEHIADAGTTVTLTDNCHVSNLMAGKTYTMVARLMDNTEYRAGGDADTVVQVTEAGEPVTGRVTFVADARDDTVRVPVTLKAASLAGRSTVIYESLYPGEVTVAEANAMTAAAEENNPGNDSQTVIFPRIGTKAALAGSGSIRDRVTYDNLLPGRQYVMAGVLMDRSTGEAIEGTAAEKRFRTGSDGSGSVTVTMDVEADALAGKGITEVVAFERCYLITEETRGNAGRVQVAAHEDLDNADQTVKLPAPGTPGTPHTGDDTKALPWAVLSLLLAAALIGILLVAGRLRQTGGSRR